MKDLIIKHIDKYKDVDEIMFSHTKMLQAIIDGIPDIIAVCRLDKTIIFYNEAGYKYYNKTPNEVKGKKCCQMLNINQECSECFHEKAIRTKQSQKVEKYIPELNIYMECWYKPVLNDSGEVILIVKQLKEITERKILENKFGKSKERYEEIFNILPEPILIIVDGEIVLANKWALKYYNNIIGRSVYTFVPTFETIIRKRIKQILTYKKTKVMFDYKVVVGDERVVDFEVSSSYILHNGKPAVLSIMRDITKMKKSLNSAAKIQTMALQQKFPIKDKANMQTVYVPAKTVSGDFFHINKIDEDIVVGIIGDVRGKGITAALNISACNVLFNDAVLISDEPDVIINYLNSKIVNYLGESYIAACCFKLDFKNNRATVVGAGINEFIFQSANDKFEKKIVKGPFLGMFEDSVFDEEIINFSSKDKFYFYTDGLEFIFEDEIKKNYCKTLTIIELKKYLNTLLSNMLMDLDGIKDDCTVVALEIK